MVGLFQANGDMVLKLHIYHSKFIAEKRNNGIYIKQSLGEKKKEKKERKKKDVSSHILFL